MARVALLPALLSAVLASCRLDMHEQPSYRPLERSAFFADGSSARPLPMGAVSRAPLPAADELFYTGRVDGEEATVFPFPVTREVLDRGQERYNVFCAPCHGFTGDGNGMIVQRGFSPPPSFHTDRLREEPVGHYFDIITHGFGAMYPYAQRVPPRDRWAIIAYIRALQLSQRATAADLPEEERRRLEAPQP